MFRAIILPIFRTTRLCVTVCGIMHPQFCRPTTSSSSVLVQTRIFFWTIFDSLSKCPKIFSLLSFSISKQQITHQCCTLAVNDITESVRGDRRCSARPHIKNRQRLHWLVLFNPYPTAFPYGNGMVLHFYQQQESSTTKTVHKVINKGLKTYV